MATRDQLNDLRADLGDTAGAFSQEELNRLLERSKDGTGAVRYYVALALGIFQLLTQAAKFADYVVNEASEKRQQVFDNLRKTYELLLTRPDVAAALGPESAGGAFQTRAIKYQRTSSLRGDEWAVPDIPL